MPSTGFATTVLNGDSNTVILQKDPMRDNMMEPNLPSGPNQFVARSTTVAIACSCQCVVCTVHDAHVLVLLRPILQDSSRARRSQGDKPTAILCRCCPLVNPSGFFIDHGMGCFLRFSVWATHHLRAIATKTSRVRRWAK